MGNAYNVTNRLVGSNIDIVGNSLDISISTPMEREQAKTIRDLHRSSSIELNIVFYTCYECVEIVDNSIVYRDTLAARSRGKAQHSR